MALNADLNAKVQKGADYIALIDTMAHAIGSHRSASNCLDDLGHGENIYWANGFTPTYTQVTTAWYDEINFYDFNNPGNQLTDYEDEAIGHFTQVVWKTSVNLGMGHAVAADGGTYIVARYTARGNYLGQYGDNVPALLAGRSSAVNRGVAVHGAACWTAGWGATTPDGTASTTLQEVGVNIMDDQWCTDNSDASFVFNASNEMCVGLPDGDADADTLNDTTGGPCNDLGAPLLCAVDGNVVLTGVANVNVCADVETAGFPSKYVDVYALISWITTTMQDEAVTTTQAPITTTKTFAAIDDIITSGLTGSGTVPASSGRKRREDRVYGGVATVENSWPWLVKIENVQTDGTVNVYGGQR